MKEEWAVGRYQQVAFRRGAVPVKIIMEIHTPDGWCRIYEGDNSRDGYTRAGEAVRAFMEFAVK